MTDFSPFKPNSPLALATSNLFIFILAIAGVIFALVAFLLIFSIIRYRWRGENQEPKQISGNTKLEIVWTVIPILTLGVVFAYMLQVMGITLPKNTNNPDLIIIGHQWWWEIHYPGYGVVTANEIHLPINQKMLVELKSADVIHDLWLPELGTKMDMVPGMTNHMYLQADKTGTFNGTCAEYCGAQHAWMRIRAIVQSPEDFDAWIKAQQATAAAPTSGQALQGARLFQDMACKSCHTISGTSAQADIGPDLSHLASRETIAAGVLDNTPQNLADWLRDPQAIKPGNHMPNFGLTDPQIEEMVTYLETLK
jgi:cytochrome c oxidase subunit 2